MTNEQKKAEEKKAEEKKAEEKKAEEKKAEEKKAEEKKAKKEKETKKNKVYDFVRRDLRAGIYSTKALGKRIVIRDRGHYYTKDKAEIEFFMNDPEIVIFDSGKSNKKK